MITLVIPSRLPAVLPFDVRKAIEATGDPARCDGCKHPTLLHFTSARKPWPCPLSWCDCVGLQHAALAEHIAAWLPRAARSRNSIPLAVSRQVIARDGMSCRYCGRRVHQRRSGGPGRLHFDHVVPYSLGGAATVDNLAVSCRRCNLAKGADPTVMPLPLAMEVALK